jgi:hypothetical protein
MLPPKSSPRPTLLRFLRGFGADILPIATNSPAAGIFPETVFEPTLNLLISKVKGILIPP